MFRANGFLGLSVVEDLWFRVLGAESLRHPREISLLVFRQPSGKYIGASSTPSSLASCCKVLLRLLFSQMSSA